MFNVPLRVKRHPVLTIVFIWLGVMTPVGMTAEAAFHLERAPGVVAQEGLRVAPEMAGVETYKREPLPPQRASGYDPITWMQHEPPPSKWDCIAKYESGGNWSINTGNGYYGGLQFSASTWRAAGGTRYASYAHQASEAEQKEVAESWLARTNWGQWPQTSRMCGYR